jgi:hypothetical protein
MDAVQSVGSTRRKNRRQPMSECIIPMEVEGGYAELSLSVPDTAELTDRDVEAILTRYSEEIESDINIMSQMK